jgi:effector-binding domain-containing protein
MMVKEIKPINFLFFRTRASIDKLDQFVPVGQQLFAEAVKHHLPVSGALQWHYYNFLGDPMQQFDFEIALPVAALPEEYDGEFHIKRTSSFRCLSEIHEGNWLALPYTYKRMMEFLSGSNYKLTANNREIYCNVDFSDFSANVTEVQLGIE